MILMAMVTDLKLAANVVLPASDLGPTYRTLQASSPPQIHWLSSLHHTNMA